ncbi:hypothetical protein SLS60_000269 [Paraconiothyrium brasiliense]|uniref:C2H2-type domain-containing protein n=1 Tax=Paraconiothyrium brasiliense TaxID=300254 RepID=A0ABR3S5S8_9PLEO
MAKGKPKVKFPEHYPEEDEDARAAREARAKAPQAKPHKRGGVHAIKDKDKTGSKWDTMTRDVMVEAALRDPMYIPFFAKFKQTKEKVKDLKKLVLLQTLASADEQLKRKAAQEQREGVKLRKEAEARRKAEEEKQRAEQQRKEQERLRREEEGQIVSDEEEEEQELPQVYLLQEDSDTSDTISTLSSSSSSYSPGKLRMFEWSFADPPSSDYWRTPRSWPQQQELQPLPLPYTPMNVVSIHEREMLHTPGLISQNQGIEPDRVARLSQHVKDCARNGVLIGPLADAVIESGSDWSERTIVQGWNGRMFFDLPRSERSDEDLADVYRQWKSKEAKKKRKSDRKRYHEAGVHKADPRLKALKQKERRKITKNVYKTSQWRPTIVYLPAYLPAHSEAPDFSPTDIFAPTRNAETLFYIRLEGESVPSFFFWAEQDGWKDPTEPNPLYEEFEHQYARRTSQHSVLTPRRFSRLVRVKKMPAPRRFSPTYTIPKTSRYETALWAIERDLYNHGFHSTLKLYHNRWLIEENKDVWNKLTSVLRNQLPPSGRFPPHPPVRLEHDPGMISIAEKLARVEAPFRTRPVLPIFIDDDWTRNDDAYWTTEERPRTPASDSMEVEMQYAIPISRNGRFVSRPATPGTPQSLHRRISDVFSWVSAVATPGSQFFNQPTPSAPDQVHEATELAFDIMVDRAPSMPYLPDMWRMMQERYQLQALAPKLCAICLKDIGDVPLEEYERHLFKHMADIAHTCPFCNGSWNDMDGRTKAQHVRWHREEQDPKPTRKSRRRPKPPELQGNAAVPDPNNTPVQRRPSVKFSDQTVGQRIAYNDVDRADTAGTPTAGETAESSPWPSASRRSSQNSQPSPKPAPKKSSFKNKSRLTIDTDHNGRRKIELDLNHTDWLYRDALHDPRRKGSENSFSGANRNMPLYTYADDGDADNDDGSDDDDDDQWPAQPGKPAGGGKVRPGEVVSGRVVEVGSWEAEEVEDEDYADEDEEEGNGDGNEDTRDEGDDQDEQDDPGYGDGNRDGKEPDSHSSSDSDKEGRLSHSPSSRKTSNSQDQNHAAGEADTEREDAGEDGSLPHSRKRPNQATGGQPSTGLVSASGVTKYKKRPSNGSEGTSPNKKRRPSGGGRYGSNRAPTVSPLTQKSSPSNRPPASGGGGDGDDDDDPSDDDNGNNGGGGGGRPASRRSSSRKSSSSKRNSTSSSGRSAFGPAPRPASFHRKKGWKAWPAPVHLWYELEPNPNAVQQEGEEYDEQDDQEEDNLAEEEMREKLDIDDAYAMLSVKKAKRPHVPPAHRKRPQNEGNAGSSGGRSPAPSPSSSLARAENARREPGVPPNTPAVAGGLLNEVEGQIPEPPSPGQLSGKISSVKTSSKRTSSISGSDIPFAKKKRDEAEKARKEATNEGKKKNRQPPKKRREEEEDERVEDERVEDERVEELPEEDEDEIEVSKPNPKPTKSTAAIKKATPAKKAAKKVKKNVAVSAEEPDAEELPDDEPSEGEESDEEGVSEYHPPRPAAKQGAKKKARPASKKAATKKAKPASKKPPAKKSKPPTKAAAVKRAQQPRRRLTEAEKLARDAEAWKKW